MATLYVLRTSAWRWSEHATKPTFGTGQSRRTNSARTAPAWPTSAGRARPDALCTGERNTLPPPTPPEDLRRSIAMLT